MELKFWPNTKRLLAKVTNLEYELVSLRESSLNTTWNMKEVVFGNQNSVNVDKVSSLTLSAYYLALNILGDTLNIPIDVFKRLEDGDKERVRTSDKYEYQVYKLLHVSPSQLHTPSEWIKLMEIDRIHKGNCVSYIIRDRLGVPIALKYCKPENVEYRFDGVRLWYTIYDDKRNIIVRDAPCWDVIHLKGFSKDGVIGTGLIDFAAESMGFGKATQKTGNKYFEEGMMNKVVLSHPGALKGEGEKNLKESFDAKLKGKGTIVLEEGTKVYPLSITNEQSQFLQSRQFGVTEISRWTNIPEFILANNDPTYSNIENFANHMVTNNVRPRVRMWEQELNWKLLGNVPEFFTEFNLDALVRADLKTQAEYFKAALGGVPWMKPNEARSLKNMNKDKSGYGDQFWPPLNAETPGNRDASNNQNE